MMSEEADESGNYYVVVHRSILDAFRLTAKEKWRHDYRRERMRRSGRSEPFAVSVGEFRGVRFTETKGE